MEVDIFNSMSAISRILEHQIYEWDQIDVEIDVVFDYMIEAIEPSNKIWLSAFLIKTSELRKF